MTSKRTSEKDLLSTSANAPVRRKTPAKPRSRRAVTAPETSETPAAEANVDAVVQAPAVAETVVEPAYHEIASLAYSYWEARGYQDGSSEEDWLRAEQALRTRAATA